MGFFFFFFVWIEIRFAFQISSSSFISLISARSLNNKLPFIYVALQNASCKSDFRIAYSDSEHGLCTIYSQWHLMLRNWKSSVQWGVMPKQVNESIWSRLWKAFTLPFFNRIDKKYNLYEYYCITLACLFHLLYLFAIIFVPAWSFSCLAHTRDELRISNLTNNKSNNNTPAHTQTTTSTTCDHMTAWEKEREQSSQGLAWQSSQLKPDWSSWESNSTDLLIYR